MSATQYVTIIDLLQQRAQQQPETAYTFLKNGETPAVSLSYQTLAQQVGSIAAWLSSQLPTGARVLLVYPYDAGAEFVAAFLGCLAAGMIAVASHPPRNRSGLTELYGRLLGSEASLILTTHSLLAKLKAQLVPPDFSTRCGWGASDRLPLPNLAATWTAPQLDPDSIAFLQYTSGSTGIPKGVTITHAGLMQNQKLLQLAFDHSERSVGVGWLPLFHDMGLIGNVLQALYVGAPCVLMSPLDFVQKPIRWLQAISRYQATTSGAPNFAYDLLCRKVTAEQLPQLDLSHWQVAFTGAEPVRLETIEQFSHKFAACGFRREAFYPCYGMAEATLFISGGRKLIAPTVLQIEAQALRQGNIVIQQPLQNQSTAIEPQSIASEPQSITAESQSITVEPQSIMSEPQSIAIEPQSIVVESQSIVVEPQSVVAESQSNTAECQASEAEPRTLVSCGQGWLDTEIIIVDPQSLIRCPDDRVGEIWVAGSGLGKGYWNQPEETAKTFYAAPVDAPESHYLRTGDLGFLHNGELFITGRLHDVLVFWGFNHYPQHIEQTVEACHPGFQAGGSAAFSVKVNGEERLVIVQEIARNYRDRLTVDEVTELIRWRVFEEHFVDVYAIVLLKPGSLPKTSSGKVQRSACRRLFLDNQLESLGRWQMPADQASDPTSVMERYFNLATHLQRYRQLTTGKIQRWLKVVNAARIDN